MRRYGAALALGLTVLFGWAELGEADGRGRGRGSGHGHHGGHGHRGSHGHGFHGHFRHHHHGFHGRAFIGASPFFWSPGYVYAPPPVYVRPQPAAYWYFCRSAQAYYPYVAACPEGWIPVPAY